MSSPQEADNPSPNPAAVAVAMVKRPRGRPRKVQIATAPTPNDTTTTPVKRPRGRPPKYAVVDYPIQDSLEVRKSANSKNRKSAIDEIHIVDGDNENSVNIPEQPAKQQEIVYDNSDYDKEDSTVYSAGSEYVEGGVSPNVQSRPSSGKRGRPRKSVEDKEQSDEPSGSEANEEDAEDDMMDNDDEIEAELVPTSNGDTSDDNAPGDVLAEPISTEAAVAKRPRGRPRKSDPVTGEPVAKRPRGRPPKTAAGESNAKKPVGRPRKVDSATGEPVAKKRVGRPPKVDPITGEPIAKKRVGRPPKVDPVTGETVKRPRGRPPKIDPLTGEPAAKKPVGRPPKTTPITGESLTNKPVDQPPSTDSVSPSAKSPVGRSPNVDPKSGESVTKRPRGRPKKIKIEEEEEEIPQADEQLLAPSSPPVATETPVEDDDAAAATSSPVENGEKAVNALATTPTTEANKAKNDFHIRIETGEPIVKRPRGRPRKDAPPGPPKEKRPVGRPPKSSLVAQKSDVLVNEVAERQPEVPVDPTTSEQGTTNSADDIVMATVVDEPDAEPVPTENGEAVVKRPRGRPRKDASPMKTNPADDIVTATVVDESIVNTVPIENGEAVVKRPRGRPRKDASPVPPTGKKPVGRPRKHPVDAPSGESNVKRPRGRPRKSSLLTEPIVKRPRGRPRNSTVKQPETDFKVYADIPMGPQAARMMIAFGDGPQPEPDTVQAVLLGTRNLIQTAVQDARMLRRREKSAFDNAKRLQSHGKADTTNRGEWSSEIMFRADTKHDSLAMNRKCGFDVEELEKLFPEEMRAYMKWNKFYSDYDKKANNDEAVKTTPDESEDEVSVKSEHGHLQDRAMRFDQRTFTMDDEWYLNFAMLRRGSFLPRRGDDLNWEGHGRIKEGVWDRMSMVEIRFLHWIGFDPESALPPPNIDTTHVLAFLGYDFFGRIVERAIALHGRDELPAGMQLSRADIEKVLQDADLKGTPISAGGEDQASLYFGPGFEDRLEMEFDEMLANGGSTALLDEEERQIRELEKTLFAKIAPPPTNDGFEAVIDNLKQQQEEKKRGKSDNNNVTGDDDEV